LGDLVVAAAGGQQVQDLAFPGGQLGERGWGGRWGGEVGEHPGGDGGAEDVLQNTIAPGGTFGWHRHPGPSLVIVKSGTATFYLAADPTCTPHVVPAGSGFVDQGHDVHVVRNEGNVDLVTVVVSLVPTGFDRRIDAPSPGICLPNG
jgi:quercetin dioxygenase-like cupin family protein